MSLGSINVDHVLRVSDADLAAFEERYDWFPDRGATVRVDDLPEDFAVDPDEIRHGGKGANQAVAAANAGADATMLGKVGPDHGSFDVLPGLADAGVDVDRVGTAADPTGRAYVFVDESGDNRIVVHAGANDAIDRAYVRDQYDCVRAADCLLLQNEIPVGPVEALLADLADDPDRPTVILDPAPPDGVTPLLSADAVDYLTPNEHEYAALEPALDAYEGVLVRKRGGDAVIVADGGRFTIDPPSVEAVDTTGAGDVLNGFLAARLAAGDSLREAVECGVVAGSLSTRESGARGGVPTLDEVRAFRSSGPANG
ncbi:MAG: PfkB family carbohydrate kinase [Haloplanus sp.]